MSENSLKEFNSLDIEPLIAANPAEPRDSSRLLVVNRKTGELLDRHFYDLPDILPPDTLIIKPLDPPIKLMYGVPPVRFEKMEAPEKQLKTE